MRPVVDEHGNHVVPPRFEVAEILNLQSIRDEARAARVSAHNDTVPSKNHHLNEQTSDDRSPNHIV